MTQKELHTIFDSYYHPLCFYAKKYLSDNNDAQDVVQEIFINIWEKQLEFPNNQALKSFLYSSVYHACIDIIKLTDIHKRHQDYIFSHSEETENKGYLTDQIETEILTELFTAIESLPNKCRAVFKLSYLEGLSIEEVAQKLDISIHTVKSQRSRAKSILYECLKNLYFTFIYIPHI